MASNDFGSSPPAGDAPAAGGEPAPASSGGFNFGELPMTTTQAAPAAPEGGRPRRRRKARTRRPAPAASAAGGFDFGAPRTTTRAVPAAPEGGSPAAGGGLIADKARLVRAVCANSCELVDLCLVQGISPNIDIGEVVPFDGDATRPTVQGALTFPRHFKVQKVNSSSSGGPTALHLAVANCYHQGKRDWFVLNELEMAQRNASLGILRSLLRSGANPSKLAPNMIVYIFDVDHKGTGATVSPSADAFDLAAFLKLHAITDSQKSMMDVVIHELVAALSSGRN